MMCDQIWNPSSEKNTQNHIKVGLFQYQNLCVFFLYSSCLVVCTFQCCTNFQGFSRQMEKKKRLATDITVIIGREKWTAPRI
jgi:hypothetical protein